MLLTVHITLIIWILRQRVRNCDKNIWSSLIWNTSARHERHERQNTTRVRHKRDTSDTSATWTTRVWHECCPNYTNATRVRNFNFDNYTIFAPLYLPYSKWKMTRTGKISFWELLFGNTFFLCQNAFEKCTPKSELW